MIKIPNMGIIGCLTILPMYSQCMELGGLSVIHERKTINIVNEGEILATYTTENNIYTVLYHIV